ncbi:MAG: hypothetical protein LDL25_04645 [Hyphomicrobiales bacterium]|nr:hypothetical protein [Hyphomicrobiales bacterium]MCA1999054.1 hypothetical protein [Hyphomicrobiales bacterium]
MAEAASSRGRTPERRGATTDLIIEPGSQDEPPIGVEIRNPGIRWDLMLVIFLRLIAAVWLLKGLSFWALILGLGDVPFPEEPRLRQALIIGFALVDCAAGVGMWLLSPWGKSLWVFAVVFEIAIGGSGFGNAVGLTALTGSLLALFFFFVLSFAVRSRHRGRF